LLALIVEIYSVPVPNKFPSVGASRQVIVLLTLALNEIEKPDTQSGSFDSLSNGNNVQVPVGFSPIKPETGGL
jgi:hypothetical protein